MQADLDFFINLATSRRSVRTFTGETVSLDELRTVLEAFRYAPSAGNRQPWRVLVITDQDEIRKIGRDTSPQSRIFEGAGALLVVYARPFDSWKHVAGGMGGVHWQLRYLNDLGAAIQNLLLAIHAAGLGAVWIGLFNQIVLSEMVKAPKDLEPSVLIPVGHYDSSIVHGKKERKPISEICFYQDFNHPLES